jgi:AAA+ superfamily predicted ATPase
MGVCSSKEGSTIDIDLFAKNDMDKQNSDKLALSVEYAYSDLKEQVFKIGSDVVEKDIRGDICGRITTVHQAKDCLGGKYLVIWYLTIKSNGNVFYGSRNKTIINEYPNKMKLSQLPIRPITWEEKEKLCERGRKFVKYGLGAHFMMYSDKLLVDIPCCGIRQIRAEGRVMVDTSSFFHFNPDHDMDRNAWWYGDEGCAYTKTYKRCSDTTKEFSREIPDCNLHLCWPTLCGFSFKTKRWGEMAVNHLSDIKFNDNAFDMLVLDNGPKEMVRGLVQNFHKDQQFTDIIQGKGGDCSFLLRGPPGVGKTLTAEVVSEVLHRPLYCVDVGELGVTPEMLEMRLKEILEVAERWNAVVLIDKCDIFLAIRTKDGVLRNAMVGIFLRLLECYDDILFLTSNRAEDIDPAFQSRMSITMEYKAMNFLTREKIWRALLSAAGIDHSNDKLAVNRLAEYDMNGRQIKTAIRLATSLAATAKESLGHNHFDQIIRYAMLNTTTGG